MKSLRYGLSILVIVLLAAGYMGSQYAALNGTAADWAAKVDRPPVVSLALVLFLAAIVLCAIRDREEIDEDS